MGRSRLDRIVQFIIPPSLVLLLTVVIIELFYGVGNGMQLFIEMFDLYVVVIFAIDLYYRWQETPHLVPYIKKHFLDLIATIPFNLIFLGVEGLILLRALRSVRIIARVARVARVLRLARYARLLRLLRFGARAPRFLRMRTHLKKAKIRKVQPHEKQMKGVLSFKVILLITINSIMGTGIWFLTAAGAKHAGPASLISWGILSLISVYIAMCFGELASMFPKAGGVYEFAKQTYGRFWSFIIGWTTSIAGSVTIAMLLLGALQYLLPLTYAHLYIPLAIALILVFSYVAYRGMQTSTYVLVTFALITLATVIAIIIPGIFKFQAGNYVPFLVFPTLSIVLAIFFIAETFFGWESAIFLSAETKNPARVMPKALVYGTLIIAALSFLLAATSIGVIPWQQYAESAAPLRDLGEIHFGIPGRIIFTLLVFTSIIGAVASWVVTAPRLLMAIAEDKLFFVQFAKIHPKYKSPYISIIFQVVVISILVIIGTGRYETLLHMLIPLILVVYSAVLLSVVILRYKRPELTRPYKAIFGKVGPFVTIFFMIFLLVMFMGKTHGAADILRISASLIAFGIPAYFFLELFYEQKYVTLRKNLLAHLRYHLYRLPLAAKTFRIILSLVPVTKDSVIMTYNAPLSSFARRMIARGIAFRRFYIVNQSKEELEVFRAQMGELHNVRTMVARSLTVPDKKIDVFIGFDVLGYVKDIPAFLREMNRHLENKGSFCFYIKHHLLNVTPNALMVEDKKKIIPLFEKEGLDATYWKQKTIFTEEIFIYGRKK